jgi:hypothetical protein
MMVVTGVRKDSWHRFSDTITPLPEAPACSASLLASGQPFSEAQLQAKFVPWVSRGGCSVTITEVVELRWLRNSTKASSMPHALIDRRPGPSLFRASRDALYTSAPQNMHAKHASKAQPGLK